MTLIFRFFPTFCRFGKSKQPIKPLQKLWLFFGLTALGCGIGLLTLMLTACSYLPISSKQILLSYFGNIVLMALNLLLPVLLIWLCWFLFARAWAAFLGCAIPCLLLAVSNYYKIMLRADPVLATDLRLLRTCGGILSHYTLDLTSPIVFTIAAAAVGLLFAVFALPYRCRGARTRFLGTFVCVLLVLTSYGKLYLSDEVYARTKNDAHINPWSDVEVYVSRGTMLGFVRSIPDMLPTPPEGYRAADAAALLAQYADADIPDAQKVNVIGVMLEAFCDLTDFAPLAQLESVAQIYAPLHELEAQSISGDLLTNIFAGGTVDSEWGFLTGYSRHDEFRSAANSYVRYFAAQGYETLYRHPGHGWFYNRQNINEYLGFSESVFTANGFGDLVDPVGAVYHSDGVLVDYLLRDLDQHGDAPLFSFSVSYQNHGPYNTDSCTTEFVSPQATAWSAESCNILNNYLYGIDNTISEFIRFTQALEARSEPIVLVLYGDHKPWLGNNNSVYTELGINFDFSTYEGFSDYYATPYLIWANSAAKNALGSDFVGEGATISPCFLMPALFDACSWEGDGFMQLSREMREVSPVLHAGGFFLADGALTTELSPDGSAQLRDFLCAQYYREQHFAF